MTMGEVAARAREERAPVDSASLAQAGAR
jgi:hypothetical protein